jgi:hypothetical protein
VRPDDAGEFSLNVRAWPLIKAVHVYANFSDSSLPSFATLHDTPGDNDMDEKRMVGDEFTSFITGMDAVWFVTSCLGRNASNKEVASSLKELQTEGMLNKTHIVLTFFDAVNDRPANYEGKGEEEIRENLFNILHRDYDDDDDDDGAELDKMVSQIRFAWVSSHSREGLEVLEAFLMSEAKLRLDFISVEKARINTIRDELEVAMKSFSLYAGDVVSILSDHVQKNVKSLLDDARREVLGQLDVNVLEALRCVDARDADQVDRIQRAVRDRIAKDFGKLKYRTL